MPWAVAQTSRPFQTMMMAPRPQPRPPRRGRSPWLGASLCGLLLLGVLLAPCAVHCQPPPAASPTEPLVQHIAAVFEVDNFTSLSARFNRSIGRANHDLSGVRLEGVSLMALQNVHSMIIYVCDAILNYNITAFVAIGSQRLVNTLTVVTHQTGIPMLAYVTEPSPLAVAADDVLSPDQQSTFFAHQLPVLARGKLTPMPCHAITKSAIQGWSHNTLVIQSEPEDNMRADFCSCSYSAVEKGCRKY
ncbi:hypothetical protein CAPTEDRAFT_189638 [Capitella teleta]|uniref:Receptor ligand binding region domain-containing protein n=1 Tax=Capitella teleta TaxID=283909 RepID=R7TFR7_CAPTE|nr:hypothetical protein CAPTEDRAFT_189638 [Capitella teleta]|eukprot:ELT90376.1 hypothetical protein CAPTEDRAFT_189638 [Capitella teleta]